MSYGLAVDAGDPAATAALYADDCEVDIDGAVLFRDAKRYTTWCSATRTKPSSVSART